MPRTSSLSSPSSSTSSLSNWLIGKPIQLASTGVRSSSVASESSTPQGCSAMWRGRPSSASTRVRKPSSSPRAARRPRPEERSSGSSSRACPRVARADVRERLGERVDLAGRHAERGTDVAHRVAHAVGVAHRDAGAALAAEALEDPLVDLGAARGLDVDVDVGQGAAQRREEPLHDQAVRERVDAGDAEQVVDQAAGAGPARGDAHVHPADEVDDLADGEEVAGEAERGDGAELGVEPLAHLVRRVAGAVGVGGEGGVAAGAEVAVGLERLRGEGRRTAVADQAAARRGAGREQEVELGDVDLADAEVGDRVEPADVGERAGVGEQPLDLAPLALLPRREPGQVHDLLRDAGHVRAVGEVALAVGAVEVAGVERHEPADRVEDVDDGRLVAGRVAHRVGEHRGDALGAGEAEGARGRGRGVRLAARGRAGQVGDREGGVARPVVDHLDREPTAEHRAPRGERRLGEVGPTTGQRATDLGVGPEDEDEPVGVAGDDVERGHRRPATHLGRGSARVGGVRRGHPCSPCSSHADELVVGAQAEVRGGDQPAQRRPAGAPAREQEDAGVPRVDLGPAARRGAPGGRGRRCRCRCRYRRATRRGALGEGGPGPEPSRRGTPDPRPERRGRRPLEARSQDRVHREVEAEDRRDAGVAAGEDEADRAVEAVAVGEGEGLLAELGRALHERRRAARAVAQRVAGGDVEVDEGVGGHGWSRRWCRVGGGVGGGVEVTAVRTRCAGGSRGRACRARAGRARAGRGREPAGARRRGTAPPARGRSRPRGRGRRPRAR